MVLSTEQYKRVSTKATYRHKDGTCCGGPFVTLGAHTSPMQGIARVIYLLVDASERRQDTRSLVFAKLRQENEKCNAREKEIESFSTPLMERYCCVRSNFFFFYSIIFAQFFCSINNQNNVFLN